MKTRRKHRCMYRDDKGFWWIDYYLPNGKRRRKKAGKTKGDADRLLRKVRTSIDAGEYVDPANSPTFLEFCDTFMERHGNHKVSYVKNERTIERLKEFFGKTKLSRITSGHIEDYRIGRREAKSERDQKSALEPSTINREVEIIRAMLSMAVKWGYMAKNVACQVTDYDEDNKRERFLTNEEVRRLLQATKHSNSPILRPCVYLALQTGARKGELLNLKWADIDFESHQLLIRDSKSGLPRRVPLSRRASWLLRKMSTRDPLAEWIFESRGPDGARRPARDTKTAWKRCLRVARIEDFHFHDLRHTFASHFCMKNGNVFALSKILGHANATMTLGRYSHLSPQYVNDQRAVMDATYSSGLNAASRSSKEAT